MEGSLAAGHVVGDIVREHGPWIKEATTRCLFRDVCDHTVQSADRIETDREIVAGHLEIHLSSLDNRTNEVMKMLTIIVTVFIPVSSIGGVYGLNFAYMLEVRWRLGHHAVVVTMATVAAVMICHFRRRRWRGVGRGGYS